MTIRPRQGYPDVGYPAQWSQDVNAAPEALVTGDYPALSGIDFPSAADQMLPALTVVGLDRYGRLIPATYGPTGEHAAGTLTFTVGNPADGETVTIDGVAYRFSANVNAVNRVALGADQDAAALNLIAAINGAGGDGYHAETVPHPTVAASSGGDGIIAVRAKQPGAQGNAIATVEAGANIAWGAVTLTGGVGGIQAIGIMAGPAVTNAAGATPTLPIHNTGVFNPDLLIWDDSFGTDDQKRLAFADAPAFTQILIRRIREYDTA